jgi:DNA polymerase/3'-5' exonuclease PolX
MKLATAQRLAGRIRDDLAPFCEHCEIAGSIRRQRPEVGDIDVVCLPKGEAGLHDLIERCERRTRCTKTGEQYRLFELQGGGQLDLWIAHAASADLFGNVTPANWATLLVCRTGSAEFNVMIARRAREVGLHWNPHAGLQKLLGRTAVVTETEEDFFRELNLEFVRPEDRET